jgi:hypothetical protein
MRQRPRHDDCSACAVAPLSDPLATMLGKLKLDLPPQPPPRIAAAQAPPL